MAGAAIEVTIDDQDVQALLRRIARRLGDLTPAMEIIGETVTESVQRNFEAGGRPSSWPVSKRAEEGGKTLVREGFGGGLLGSIHYQADSDSVTVGTDKIYGAVHQFGAEAGSFGEFVFTVREHIRKSKSGKASTVKAHQRTAKLPWGDIPARPFLLVQDEDWIEIKAALNDYLTGDEA